MTAYYVSNTNHKFDLVNNSYFVPGTVQVLVSIGVSFMLAPMFI